MKRFKVAALQMDTRDDKEENLLKIEALIDEAARGGAKLIGLPEFATFIGEPMAELEQAEPINGPTIRRLAAKARAHRLWLHCGSMQELIPGEQRVYNTSVVLNPNGAVAGVYRKIHLFDVAVSDGPAMQESRWKKRGAEITVVASDLAQLGLSICYDLRFPELYRIMALRGAELFFVPAMFTYYTGKDHWETLLRARAIENQCYCIAPAQTGIKPAFQSFGRSLIINPWGDILAQGSDQEGVVQAEVDLEVLQRIRQEVPSLKNRQPQSYRWVE